MDTPSTMEPQPPGRRSRSQRRTHHARGTAHAQDRTGVRSRSRVSRLAADSLPRCTVRVIPSMIYTCSMIYSNQYTMIQYVPQYSVLIKPATRLQRYTLHSSQLRVDVSRGYGAGHFGCYLDGHLNWQRRSDLLRRLHANGGSNSQVEVGHIRKHLF